MGGGKKLYAGSFHFNRIFVISVAFPNWFDKMSEHHGFLTATLLSPRFARAALLRSNAHCTALVALVHVREALSAPKPCPHLASVT